MKVLGLVFGLFFVAETAAAGDNLLFATEPYTPFTFQEATGPVRGISVDQVRGIMEGSGITYSIEVMPWARAIALAETQPDTCVFSAAQTPEREGRFKWILPLAISRTILVKHRNAGVAAKTLDEAKAFTIGTYREDFTETILRNMQFPKVDISANFDVTLAKLLRDRIDMMPMSQQIYDRLRKRGIEIESVAPLSSQRFGIACNLTVRTSTIARLQAKLESMIGDGTQAEIYRTYGMEPPEH